MAAAGGLGRGDADAAGAGGGDFLGTYCGARRAVSVVRTVRFWVADPGADARGLAGFCEHGRAGTVARLGPLGGARVGPRLVGLGVRVGVAAAAGAGLAGGEPARADGGRLLLSAMARAHARYQCQLRCLQATVRVFPRRAGGSGVGRDAAAAVAAGESGARTCGVRRAGAVGGSLLGAGESRAADRDGGAGRAANGRARRGRCVDQHAPAGLLGAALGGCLFAAQTPVLRHAHLRRASADGAARRVGSQRPPAANPSARCRGLSRNQLRLLARARGEPALHPRAARRWLVRYRKPGAQADHVALGQPWRGAGS